MWPVVGIPPVWTGWLDRFRDCFRRSDQFQHFAEYVIGLIVSSRFSVQAINDLFTGHRHASSKRGFLGEAPLVARAGDAAACAPGPGARRLLQSRSRLPRNR